MVNKVHLKYKAPRGQPGTNTSYDNTIYRKSEIGNSVAITNLHTKPGGSQSIDTASYYDLPSVLKEHFYTAQQFRDPW